MWLWFSDSYQLHYILCPPSRPPEAYQIKKSCQLFQHWRQELHKKMLLKKKLQLLYVCMCDYNALSTIILYKVCFSTRQTFFFVMHHDTIQLFAHAQAHFKLCVDSWHCHYPIRTRMYIHTLAPTVSITASCVFLIEFHTVRQFVSINRWQSQFA